MRVITCPYCDAENILEENEREGDTIFCVYCGAPLKLVKKEGSKEIEAEEDEEF